VKVIRNNVMRRVNILLQSLPRSAERFAIILIFESATSFFLAIYFIISILLSSNWKLKNYILKPAPVFKKG